MTPKRHVIPVFVPHLGCPNDCVFCNQRRISGQAKPATPETVARAIGSLPDGLPEDVPVQLAFYGGSFTAIPEADQNVLLEAAAPLLDKYEQASIRVSTRPDCINSRSLQRLGAYGVKTIELGAQSMCPDVLAASRRGHTAEDTVKAARLVKASGMELILQMMTGLPGDTSAKSVETAEKLIALCPDGVRVYPTVVIRDTLLYNMWQRGIYKEHTVEDAVALCAQLYKHFEKSGIPIIRMGLNPTEDLSGGDAVCGAYHPAFGELVFSRIYLERALACMRPMGSIKRVTLGVSKNRVSCMVGHAKSNIEALRREFGPISVRVKATDAGPGEIVIMSIENDA